MKKFIIATGLIFITHTFAQNYTISTNLKEVLKYKNEFTKAAENKNKELEEEFKQLTKDLVENNYKPKNIKEKNMLIGFFLFASTTINKNIDNNTQIENFKYNPNKDTIEYDKIIHDIKNNPKYSYLKKMDKKTFFHTLKLIGKSMAYITATKVCSKSPSNPYTYSLLNSGTTIKEKAYYKNGNQKILLSAVPITKKTCDEIEKYPSPTKWLLSRPEVKELMETIKKYNNQ